MPKRNQPAIQFAFKVLTWIRVANACENDGYQKIADSIFRRIKGKDDAEVVDIDVPLDCCGSIASACLNANLGVGVAFATAASSHKVKSESKPSKPVDRESLKNAREELERMET